MEVLIPLLRRFKEAADVYTLTGSIITDGDGIVIERNDTVLVGAAFTLQGTGTPSSMGIYLSGKSNVTIKDMNIKAFETEVFCSKGIRVTTESSETTWKITNMVSVSGDTRMIAE